MFEMGQDEGCLGDVPDLGRYGLDVAAMGVCLAGVPQVDDLAFDTCGLLAAPVSQDDLAVQDLPCRACLG
jgi:hypothetical protein